MARKSVKKAEVEALDQALRGLFRNLQARALPDALRPGDPSNLLDQLLSAPSKARPRQA